MKEKEMNKAWTQQRGRAAEETIKVREKQRAMGRRGRGQVKLRLENERKGSKSEGGGGKDHHRDFLHVLVHAFEESEVSV